ncbi:MULTISPECIES: OmpA family protein [unclassified Bradyrhizobium]|uniref:OmpA family protein n=1 Tax=unclassified Bradyrhizobium TaxID=2631580 RepID=UPI0028ECCCC4|nr:MULTISPECIES: OmpA family protein [unclassified Bradyrhizobium]
MLAPSPNSVPPSPAMRVDACAVAGEEAPVWLAAAFAIAGTLIAVMSAALWQQGTATPPTATAAMPVTAVPQRDDRVADAAPKRREARIVEPAPIIAPPTSPAIAPVVIAPPTPPIAPAAPPEPQGTTKPPAECFAPLAIGFERGSARPNPADMKRSLAILQRALARHGEATIIIEGHTDASGTEDLNVLLSYSRAKEIAAQLKREGLSAQRMSVRAAGAGEARGDAQAVAGDRKAVLRIAGVDDCSQLTATKRP